MTNTDLNWDDARRVVEELDLKIHLASMELRDRWAKLRPRVTEELAAIGQHLQALRDELLGELTNKRPPH